MTNPINSDSRPSGHLSIDPWGYFKALLTIIVVLHIFSAFAVWARVSGAPDYLNDVAWYFNVGLEQNIPTLYSVLIWSTAAAITGLIARFEVSEKTPFKGRWRALSLIFLFLAFDEGMTFHEHIGDLTEEYLTPIDWIAPTGYLYFIWVLPYGGLVMLLAGLYAPFLDALPSRTKWGLILSAAVFLGGAMGIEMISASVYETKTVRHSVLYAVLYSIEEFFEMLGVALLNYFMLDYLRARVPTLSLSLRPAKN
jgi:hypothetical protein